MLVISLHSLIAPSGDHIPAGCLIDTEALGLDLSDVQSLLALRAISAHDHGQQTDLSAKPSQPAISMKMDQDRLAEGNSVRKEPPSGQEDDLRPTDSDGGPALEDLVAAIDMLEEGDFGANKLPKLKPLSLILGYSPSRDQISAAMALRESLA